MAISLTLRLELQLDNENVSHIILRPYRTLLQESMQYKSQKCLPCHLSYIENKKN